jgi:hypothetical protein
MAGPSKKMHVSDEEVLYKLCKRINTVIFLSEYSSDSEINVKSSSCCEQSVSSDEEENVCDSSSMQHGIWAKSGAERPRIIFTGKPGMKVDLEDPSNPLEYSELFCTQETAEVTARETNRYAKIFLENTSNLKLRSRAQAQIFSIRKQTEMK